MVGVDGGSHVYSPIRLCVWAVCVCWQVGRYIPPAWLQHTEVAEWAGEVEKLWPDLISKDLQELEILFVEQCRDRPM